MISLCHTHKYIKHAENQTCARAVANNMFNITYAYLNSFIYLWARGVDTTPVGCRLKKKKLSIFIRYQNAKMIVLKYLLAKVNQIVAIYTLSPFGISTKAFQYYMQTLKDIAKYTPGGEF